MMNFTKKAGAVAATTLLLATSANAAVFNASASFRTIADISITENAALSFGTSISGKAGTTCTVLSEVTADGAGTPPTSVDALAFPGDISGDGCVGTTDAVNGDYTFTGAADSTVTVLMATVTDTDFSFAPSGQYNDQDAATDATVTYFSDAPFNVSLLGTSGTNGDGRLSVGGTLTIINDLTASTSYAIAYDISVVY
jgi:hypothetical protein